MVLAVWLKFWTDANEHAPNERIGYYLGIYTAFQVLGVFSFGVLVWYVYIYMPIRPEAGPH
jgi:ATP-binding cassette, subfamily C (CFTR/MRP), member 1